MRTSLTAIIIILAFAAGFVGGASWSSLPPLFDPGLQQGLTSRKQYQAAEKTREKNPPLAGSDENSGFIVSDKCSKVRISGIDLYYDPADGSRICVAAPGGTAYAGQPYKPHVNSVPNNCALIPEESNLPPAQRPESSVAFDQRVYCATVPQLNGDALQEFYQNGELPPTPQ